MTPKFGRVIAWILGIMAALSLLSSLVFGYLAALQPGPSPMYGDLGGMGIVAAMVFGFLSLVLTMLPEGDDR